MADAIRLDRLLANLGLGSRREVAGICRQGRVLVDGEVVRDAARKVDRHRVLVDGAPLDHPDGVLVALHKPVGFVVSHASSEGPSVFSLLPPHWSARLPQVVAVGRLDKDSSGLLLVTDDHALVHRLGSPRRHVTKRYRITLAERPADPRGWVERFASGTLLLRGEERPCRPATLAFDPDDPRRGEVVLTEGRHRQLRRMVAACGGEVVDLHRSAIGGVVLGDLPPGAWRDVDPQELGGEVVVVVPDAVGDDTSGPSGGAAGTGATVVGTGDDGSGASSDA